MKRTAQFTALWLIAIASVALALPTALAVDPDYGYYTETYETASNKEPTLIFNAPSSTSTKQIILKNIDVTGDNADVVLSIYGGTASTTIAATHGASITNITLTATNIFATNDKLVIQRTSGVSTWHYLYSLGSGEFNIYPAVTTAVAAGDKVYRMSNVGTHAVGSATLRFSGDCVFAAQVRMPLAVGLVSSAGTSEYINNATVLYSDQFMN